MASLKAPSVPKLKAPKVGIAPKVKPPVIKGAPAAKIKAAPVMKKVNLPNGSLGQRALAKAAAGASHVSGKRNPNYPTR